jgi:hypothetical protein
MFLHGYLYISLLDACCFTDKARCHLLDVLLCGVLVFADESKYTSLPSLFISFYLQSLYQILDLSLGISQIILDMMCLQSYLSFLFNF